MSRILPLAAITMMLLTGCEQDSSSAAAQMQGQAQAVDVSVVTVNSSNLPMTTELQGRTSASETAEVRPQVGGIIQKRLFTEGAWVKKGDVLYQIEPESYEATLAQAKANLQTAKATLTSAQLKDKRYQALVKAEGVSQQDAADTHASFLEAQASVAAYEAAVKTASIDLKRTKVRAPISGYIGISSVTAGALVTADQDTALTSINCLNPMYVDLTESSKAILALKKSLANGNLHESDMKVTLTLEDGTTYEQQGKLLAREVAVDTATGSVTLRAEFNNPNELLLPGMFVRASFAQAMNPKGIKVLQQGISHNNNGEAYALVVDQQGKVAQKTVELGNAIGNEWIVTSGLSDGDKVIVEGSSKVRVGSQVNAHAFNEDVKTASVGGQ